MIYVLIGESGSGKDTIAKELSKLGYKQVISYTTRPPRYKGEDTHIFITPEEVKNYELAAYTMYDGYEYFSTPQQIRESDIYILDRVGLDSFKTHGYPHRVIYIEVPEDIRESRMKGRGDKEPLERILHDREAFTNIRYDYKIPNIDLQNAVDRIVDIIKWEKEKV